MSIKEINKIAHDHFTKGWCTGIVLFIYRMFVATLLAAVIRLFSIFAVKRYGPFEIIYEYVPARTRMIVYGVMLFAAIMIIYVPALYMLRRYYIGIIYGREMSTTRQYFGAYIRQTKKVAVSCASVRLMLKFFTLVPAMLSSYIVYRCAFVSRLENLNTAILIVFMLSLGFTLVWIGFWIKYCISLCLAPYIMTLSPKMDPFDACDLSCRLMDGKHTVYISFWFYNLRYILPCALVFPAFICVPRVQISYTVFVRELLGMYWQDKYPLMIERWKRRALSL